MEGTQTIAARTTRSARRKFFIALLSTLKPAIAKETVGTTTNHRAPSSRPKSSYDACGFQREGGYPRTLPAVREAAYRASWLPTFALVIADSMAGMSAKMGHG